MVESKLQHFANYDRYIIHLMSRTAMCKCTAAISNHTIHTCTHTHTKHTDVGNEIDTWYMWKPVIISKLMKQTHLRECRKVFIFSIKFGCATL